MPEDLILKQIADNPSLLEAVRRTLLKQFAQESLGDYADIDNALLGQKMRARLDGVKGIEEGFREILRYKTLPEKKPEPNQAR